jgi:hypothetical protein
MKRKSDSTSNEEERPIKKPKLSSEAVHVIQSSSSKSTTTSSEGDESTIEEYSTDAKRLDSFGRICWMDYENAHQPYLRYNSNKKIDDVSLSLDTDKEEIVIRHDHSECPEFWIETRIGLQDLKEFLGENGYFLGIKKDVKK